MAQAFSSSDSLPRSDLSPTSQEPHRPWAPSNATRANLVQTQLYTPPISSAIPTDVTSTPPASCSRLALHPHTVLIHGVTKQQVPAPAQLCTGHRRPKGKQTRAVSCRSRTQKITQASANYSTATQPVALTGPWSSPTGSLVLSPAFQIILRPGLNKDRLSLYTWVLS